MTYFLVFLGCVLVLCLVIALAVGLNPPGGAHDSQAGDRSTKH